IVIAVRTEVLGTDVFAVMRLNPDGSPDVEFGDESLAMADAGLDGGSANAVAIQKDGKIVAAGEGPGSDFGVARWLPDGTPDPAFNGGKVASVDFGQQEYANAVAIQKDGKIVAGGLTEGGNVGDFALARLNTDGSPDAFFGAGGRVVTDFGGF